MERTQRDGVWKEGRINVSLVTVGTQAAQLLATGLELPEKSALPRFKADLLRVGAGCILFTRGFARRELFVALDEGHRWVEFLELSPADLSTAEVDQVRIVDNSTGLNVRLLLGSPPSRTHHPYEKVRGGSAVSGFDGDTDLPAELERLDYAHLTVEMRTVVKVAVEVYRKQLRAVVCFKDHGERMALTFAAATSSGAATLLLNLEDLGREVANGLSEAALRAGLAWPGAG